MKAVIANLFMDLGCLRYLCMFESCLREDDDGPRIFDWGGDMVWLCCGTSVYGAGASPSPRDKRGACDSALQRGEKESLERNRVKTLAMLLIMDCVTIAVILGWLWWLWTF